MTIICGDDLTSSLLLPQLLPMMGSIFFSMFIFDTMGDRSDVLTAMWAALAMVLVPLGVGMLLYMLRAARRHRDSQARVGVAREPREVRTIAVVERGEEKVSL